jgi:hypothetical protein
MGRGTGIGRWDEMIRKWIYGAFCSIGVCFAVTERDVNR